MIGYRLGLSKSRVSMLLRSAMRKLGVRTRSQLVIKLRDFQAVQ
jgi:DNA-binding CsgD family transcriptional regulator